MFTPVFSRAAAHLVSLVVTIRHRAERGAGVIEYVLLMSLIVLACIAALSLFGNATSKPYTGAANGLAG